MGEGLHVTGGRGGVAADIEDLRRVADELDRSGDVLRHLAERARHLTTSGDLLASAALSPGTAASAQAQLVDAAFGPRGLLPQAIGVEGAARGIRGVALAFETRDAATAGWIEAREAATGYLVGRALPFLPAAIPAITQLALLAGTIHAGEEFYDQGGFYTVWQYASGDIDRAELDRRLSDVRSEALDDLTDDGLAVLNRLLIAHPELTDTLVGGGPAMLQGLASWVPGGESTLSALGIDLPRTFEELTSGIIAAGGSQGWFDDTRPVVVTGTHADSPHVLRMRNVVDIFASQGQLQREVTKPDTEASAIRVIRVGGVDDPAWIVQVPGTQEWPLASGRDPSDFTTNLVLEADHDAEILDAIADAMDTAGVGPGDPVMMTGHSQGGIAAVAFAGHGELGGQFNVTHVVTGGSPVGRIDLPDHVQLLALEHDQDPVPRVESDPNPDRPNVTTVTRDVSPLIVDVMDAHSSDLYASTASHLYDPPVHPSVASFLGSSEHFLVGDATATDYVIERSDP